MIALKVVEFVFALGGAISLVLIAVTAFRRFDQPTIICWNCIEEYAVRRANCPCCGVVKEKPYRCKCGHLHPAGQSPCERHR